MNHHSLGYLVWAYVPNADGDGWNPPYVAQPAIGEIDGDAFPTAADAHQVAKILRAHYPGHLFAVRPVISLPKLAA